MSEDNSPEDWRVILAQVYQAEPKSWVPVAEMLIESAAEDDNIPLELVQDAVIIPKDELVQALATVLQKLLDYTTNYDS